MDTDRELDALDAEWDANANALAVAMAAAKGDVQALGIAKRFLPRLREIQARKRAVCRGETVDLSDLAGEGMA